LSWACLNLLIALSFQIIYAPTKTFYFSHAAAISGGAYLFLFFASITQLSVLPASLVAVTAITVIFCAFDWCLFRSLRNGAYTWIGMVASIGLYIVLQNVISITFGDETKMLHAITPKLGHRVFGAYIANSQLMTMGVGLGLFFVLLLFFQTRLGRAIRGVSSNRELCNIFGISAEKITLYAVGIGSALGAVAGILSAADTDMTPTMGFHLLLNGVIIMIIGGLGNVGGLLIGALFLSAAQNLSAYYLNSQWMDAVAFLILILFLIWRPVGFSGKRLRKVEV
jgi:branched-subunit amino acid ABC-type transport system permease component